LRIATWEVLVVHRNPPLTETGRLRLARCVVDDGWPVRRAAERFQVSHTTAARWAAQYRQDGPAGMADRSSRPHASPARTARRTERRIVGLRVSRRLGPARIALRLALHASTVHAVLARYRCPRLAHLDRGTGSRSGATSARGPASNRPAHRDPAPRGRARRCKARSQPNLGYGYLSVTWNQVAWRQPGYLESCGAPAA
jgi:transposase-like protein